MSEAPTATGYTLEFVLSRLPAHARDILEVGCGEGELAQRLGSEGFKVVALDSSGDCVEAARARGVDARTGEWPIEIGEDQRFDAVLFTRSLHHIHQLDAAVAAAVAALRPGGRIIVEDFRIEADSARTQAWFGGLVRLLDAGNLFRERSAAETILEKLDLREHQRELHASTAMAQALRSHGKVEEQDAAYYFRYAEAQVEPKIARLLLDYELSLIDAGAIDPLGKRFVLSPNS